MKPEKINTLKKVVVIGGGSSGIGVIASIRKRVKDADITVVEPNDCHYYQPAWTLVGGGLFDINKTQRAMRDVIPSGVSWLQDSVVRVDPNEKYIETRQGKRVSYDFLIVSCGLVLRWDKIEGLEETLGFNGVTSNYRFDLAEYTWQLVREMQGGKAIFSQPTLPIKCAGAPQKALYLSCDHWRRQGVLNNINVNFCLAGTAVFGIPQFVPPLSGYLEKYRAQVNFNHNLIRIDGENRQAIFAVETNEEEKRELTLPFDMLHVVPPQSAPAFISQSGLADGAGWCDVDKLTLQHKHWPDIFAVGDCCSTPNAKTLAAARKQVVVVAENVAARIHGTPLTAHYDGYGSCPLTVEKGKVVLAEFGYDGKLLPTFPLLDATQPSRMAWWLKAWFLPRFYWAGMLRGVEWFAGSKRP
ncbi:TPA: NAD(P)/FAD-dependent oxidoreductase [Serratia marcescens]|nr:NAD(P)/FAD-dependent oxidoreductase [Serratia marcescens]HCR2985336.1 NAD(P)/FAD-dependent oxidoreductase [Serratia marcescens]HCR2986628.1 NAD(P)/FAD-dependent oxidoreductase [Serratia marcescens]HCR3010569.1 NAD(P)/FAD-dependent oxidoreductase [Serratia marcescens]HCR3015299.1 NAD(P)/FAD-dependent oxidoreductase [Serratia marcescens]